MRSGRGGSSAKPPVGGGVGPKVGGGVLSNGGAVGRGPQRIGPVRGHGDTSRSVRETYAPNVVVTSRELTW